MTSAAIAAPARGGRVVFNIDAQGQCQVGADSERISLYLARLDDIAPPLSSKQPWRDAHHRLIAHCLRDHEALDCRHRPRHVQPLTLARTALGKPYWPASRWQLNWSHSHDLLALAIAPKASNDDRRADSGSLGVDIERLGRTRDWAALMTRYFHADEHANAHDERGFLRHWTRKEAVLKAHGMGLRIDLKSLNTAPQHIRHDVLGHWACVSLILHDGHPHRASDVAVLSLSWPSAGADKNQTPAPD